MKRIKWMSEWTAIWKSPSSHPIRANTQSEFDTNRRFSAIRLSYVVQSVAFWVQIHPDPRDSSKELLKTGLYEEKTDTCKQMAANMSESLDMKFSWANRKLSEPSVLQKYPSGKIERQKEERQNKGERVSGGRWIGLGFYTIHNDS